MPKIKGWNRHKNAESVSDIKNAWSNDDGRKLQIKEQGGGYVIRYTSPNLNRWRSLDAIKHNTYQDAYCKAMKFIKGYFEGREQELYRREM